MNKYATIGVILMLFGFIGFMAQAAAADEGVGVKLKTIEELVKEAQEGVNFIAIEKMKKRIQDNDKLILLDVRTEREYQAGHIKGAAWLERGLAEFVLARTLPLQDAEIIVYCKAGNRTGLVVKALKSAGYKNVAGLDGGFDEWARQGNPVHNFLGEFKMVNPAKINAASFGVDYYQNKKNP
ncbi:MAG: rhodanese-like domain-containing protein [Deltaproteobacteria bacterium]|nr:rhodanese-like domain-containing protein [Deltaproteobacteria bacterium]MBF0527256.1 rhodanese-like domain-containing protein [Deltaproteobacteria bacterium]